MRVDKAGNRIPGGFPGTIQNAGNYAYDLPAGKKKILVECYSAGIRRNNVNISDSPRLVHCSEFLQLYHQLQIALFLHAVA